METRDDTEGRYDNDPVTWDLAHSQAYGFGTVMAETLFIDDHTDLEWYRKDVTAHPDGDRYWSLGARRALQIVQERFHASLEAEWRDMDPQALQEAYSVIWNDLTQWGRTIQHASSDERYWKHRKGPGALRNRIYAAERKDEAMTDEEAAVS